MGNIRTSLSLYKYKCDHDVYDDNVDYDDYNDYNYDD